MRGVLYSIMVNIIRGSCLSYINIMDSSITNLMAARGHMNSKTGIVTRIEPFFSLPICGRAVLGLWQAV